MSENECRACGRRLFPANDAGDGRCAPCVNAEMWEEMNPTVILHTVQDRGDHAADVDQPLELSEEETEALKRLLEGVLVRRNEDGEIRELDFVDYLTVRLTLPAAYRG